MFWFYTLKLQDAHTRSLVFIVLSKIFWSKWFILSHLTRISEEILNAVPELEIRGVTKQKLKLYLEKGIDNLVKEVINLNSSVKQLNKIVIVIRKALS